MHLKAEVGMYHVSCMYVRIGVAYLATAPDFATSFLALEEPMFVNGMVYFVANPLTLGLYILMMSIMCMCVCMCVCVCVCVLVRYTDV